MLALIVAGGSGSRLGMGEKPLVNICNRPMISYVLSAFEEYGCECVVVSSQKSPCTNNWCRANGIPLYVARGLGYVEDMVEAVLELEEVNPLFTSVSDIPCIAPDIIGRIFALYAESGKDACSVWVPENLCREYGCRTAYVEQVCGVNAVPAGINILRGEGIVGEQDELQVILREKRLAFNVNTREELRYVQQSLCHEEDSD
jgi:adenosylcobinamide-phosphate guanylyltransferase